MMWNLYLATGLVAWTACNMKMTDAVGENKGTVKVLDTSLRTQMRGKNTQETEKRYFEVADAFGQVCIRARLHPIIKLIYLSRDHSTGVYAREAVIEMSDNPLVQGTCGEREAEMKLAWDGAYSLFFRFEIRDSEWMATKVEFLVNTFYLKTPVSAGISFSKLADDQVVIRTPIGSSFQCASPIVLDLDVPSKAVITTSVLEIPNIEIQAFFVPSSGFSQGYNCPLSETAEVAENRIAVIVIGCLVGVIVLVAAVLVIVRSRKR